MNVEILPYQNVGQFSIGILKETVNGILGDDFIYETFSYSSDSRDRYNSIGIDFDYDVNMKCISIQIYLPSRPIYLGQDLLALSLEDIALIYGPSENNAYLDGADLLLLDKGIGFSFGDDIENRKAILVTIFQKNLFDNYLDGYEKVDLKKYLKT